MDSAFKLALNRCATLDDVRDITLNLGRPLADDETRAVGRHLDVLTRIESADESELVQLAEDVSITSRGGFRRALEARMRGSRPTCSGVTSQGRLEVPST